jgi:hypothetical protein
MKARAAMLIGLQCGACMAGEPPTSGAETVMRGRPSDEAIRKAVREVLDDTRETLAGTKDSGPLIQGSAFSGDPAFAKAFAKAAVPSCLGPDALRHQPTSISTKNWTFGVSGVFALPFLVAAAAGGKCK